MVNYQAKPILVTGGTGFIGGRLAERLAPLAVKPDRLAERIEEAFSEPDPRLAMLVMTEVQSETVAKVLPAAVRPLPATALTLAWTWYLLGKNPEAEKKFHAEVDEVLGDRDANQCTQVDMCRDVLLAEANERIAAHGVVVIGQQAVAGGRCGVVQHKCHGPPVESPRD